MSKEPSAYASAAAALAADVADDDDLLSHMSSSSSSSSEDEAPKKAAPRVDAREAARLRMSKREAALPKAAALPSAELKAAAAAMSDEDGDLQKAAKALMSAANGDDDENLQQAAAAMMADDVKGSTAADVKDDEVKDGEDGQLRDAAAALQTNAEEEKQEEKQEGAVVSFEGGAEVETKFRGQWVPATVLGFAPQTKEQPSGYDLRFADGVIQRNVTPTLIRNVISLSKPEKESRDGGREAKNRESTEVKKKKRDPGWHVGDLVEAEDETKWRRGVVTAVVDDSYEIESEGELFRTKRIRPAPDTYGRALLALSNQLRRGLKGAEINPTKEALVKLLAKCQVKYVPNRLTALCKVETLRVSSKKHAFVDCGGSVVRVTKDSDEMFAGDEVLSVQGVSVAEMAAEIRAHPKKDQDLVSALESALKQGNFLKLRRTSVLEIGSRELDALFFAVAGQGDLRAFLEAEAPEGGEADLVLVVDLVRTALGRHKHISRPNEALGEETTFDAAKFLKKRLLLELPLYGPGHGLGGPKDDSGQPKRKPTTRQIKAVIDRYLDQSGDGVVSKEEFLLFVFGEARNVEEIKLALLKLCSHEGAAGLFDSLDRDGNGSLGKKTELIPGLARKGLGLLPQEAETLVGALDGDGDGCIGLAELQKFVGEPQTAPLAKKEDVSRPTSRRKAELAIDGAPSGEALVKSDPTAALALYVTRCLAFEDDLREVTAKLRASEGKRSEAHKRHAAHEARLTQRIHEAEQLVPQRKQQQPVIRRVRPPKKVPLEPTADVEKERLHLALTAACGGVLEIAADRALMSAESASLASSLARAEASRAIAAARREVEARRHRREVRESTEAAAEERNSATEARDNAEAALRLKNRDLALLKAQNKKLELNTIKESSSEDAHMAAGMRIDLRRAALENEELRGQLSRLSKRESSLLGAWRQSTLREKKLEEQLHSREIECQRRLREARRIVEAATKSSNKKDFTKQPTDTKQRHRPPSSSRGPASSTSSTQSGLLQPRINTFFRADGDEEGDEDGAY